MFKTIFILNGKIIFYILFLKIENRVFSDNILLLFYIIVFNVI